MEVSGDFRAKSTALMAVISLAIVGCSLLASTWQTMLHQKNVDEQHLEYMGQSVLNIVESSLRLGPVRLSPDRLSPQTIEVFNSLEAEKEILFAGITDQRGKPLLLSNTRRKEAITVSPEALESLLYTGEWAGSIILEGKEVYVRGKLLAPIRGQILTMSESPRAPIFLLVGINTHGYSSMNKGFRENIFLQAGYILLVATVCCFFAFSFFSRRSQAERGKALEKFHDKLLDNLPDALITLSPSHSILSANPAAPKIFSYNINGSLVGKTLSALSGEIAQSIKKQCSNPRAISWDRVDSGSGYYEILVLPFYDNSSSFMAIIRDRTKLWQLEQSLANAEKLALVGKLAAGVAHEVRNPLSALRGFAQYFLKRLTGKHPEEEYARTMVTEADRLNRVITDLLFLAKPKRIHPISIDIESIINEIRILMRFDLEQKQVVIESELSEPTIFADLDAFKQVLINLVLNSLDALIPPSAPIVIASGVVDGFIWIEVRDEGCGMNEEQKLRAFDPFFTAKARGTGLGLALVHGIMIDHGGSAKIFSEQGKGCTIRLFFPLHNDNEKESFPLEGTPCEKEKKALHGLQLSLMHEDHDE